MLSSDVLRARAAGDACFRAIEIETKMSKAVCY